MSATTVTITRFRRGTRTYTFRPPLVVKCECLGIWVCCSNDYLDLDQFGCERTQAKALKALRDNFDHDYRCYTEALDKRLTPDAQELKRRLLAAVTIKEAKR